MYLTRVNTILVFLPRVARNCTETLEFINEQFFEDSAHLDFL